MEARVVTVGGGVLWRLSSCIISLPYIAILNMPHKQMLFLPIKNDT